MKRIRLWLREFTLSQQLICIVFFVVIGIAIIYLFPVTSNVNAFVDDTIYSQLRGINQDLIIRGESAEGNLIIDSNFSYARYNPQSGIAMVYQGSKSDISVEVVQSIVSRMVNSSFDGLSMKTGEVADKLKADGTTIYFVGSCPTLTSCTITMASNAYQEAYKEALVNSIILTIFSMTAMILVALFIWISGIIHPLSQMRKVVNAIRNDMPVDNKELMFNRYDEIGDLASAIAQMKQYIDKQDHIKEEMIQNISHDLKTPIATIKSYAESIKDGIYPYGTLEDSVDVIVEAAGRLEKKVQSLLLLNRIEYIKDDAPKADTVDMAEIIDKVVSEFKVIHPSLSWNMECDNTLYHGQSEPWRIVIENLVENATRYAKIGITIKLKKGNLSVANDGPRIPEETLQTIFRPYEVGNKGKFGLGLSIVKKVCDTYGYNVHAENLSDGVIFKIAPDNPNRKALWKKEKQLESKNKDGKTKAIPLIHDKDNTTGASK